MSSLHKLSRVDWRALPGNVAMFPVMALLAQSEWTLALAVGWPPVVAWCAPVALDLYVLSAKLARRELLPAIVVSGASVWASHAVTAAPGAWQSGAPGVGHLVWQLAAVCSSVPLFVFYRSHVLTHGAPRGGVVDALVARLRGAQPATRAPRRPGGARQAQASPAAAVARVEDAGGEVDGPAPVGSPIAGMSPAQQVQHVAEQMRAGAPDTPAHWRPLTGWTQRTATRRIADARALLLAELETAVR